MACSRYGKGKCTFRAEINALLNVNHCYILFFSLFLLLSPMVSPDGVAVCLSCGNEWTVRAPGVKKKRKCPVCGKYRIKLKSELNEGEKGEILKKCRERGGSSCG